LRKVTPTLAPAIDLAHFGISGKIRSAKLWSYLRCHRFSENFES